MAMVLSCQVLTGTGLFCSGEFRRSLHALRNNTTAVRVVLSHTGIAEVSGEACDTAGSLGGTSHCSCKKHKKCPPIPRATITSNPTNRFHEIRFQAKSERPQYVVAAVTDHRFTGRGDWPLMELAWSAPFFCSSPLSLSSVLLI